jgi:solute carrier family 25 oxoglutarate transporter 11
MIPIIVQDGIFCHFLASMISGLVTTIASMPVDIAKTRLQNQKYVDGEQFVNFASCQ